ncbi:MAG: hypothetical protein A3B13_00145 [Candidatus Liptonbacteria bacterium RIFCSPLOWO2_01_FULL_45_15]|uniref:Uncharacterized protein n=1 Tax=Candidatus Liptonbacteria bacterium RIFCSPLOWO2_01_FULL_45_15 TaxID=1798649 RepID=A0A1G2CG60_9BACT|nr:MAG: hypothetical protein A3B13_00145 [Candidatus Liptonbacteria bacterium RIFCSPLOWO2_01_FULL_45_15]
MKNFVGGIIVCQQGIFHMPVSNLILTKNEGRVTPEEFAECAKIFLEVCNDVYSGSNANFVMKKKNPFGGSISPQSIENGGLTATAFKELFSESDLVAMHIRPATIHFGILRSSATAVWRAERPRTILINAIYDTTGPIRERFEELALEKLFGE